MNARNQSQEHAREQVLMPTPRHLVRLCAALLLGALLAAPTGAEAEPEAPEATDAQAASTTVEEALFALELPGAWESEPVDEHGWRYVLAGGGEQLLVDARLAAAPLTEAEQRELIDRLVGARRTAEREAADGAKLRLGQVDVERRGAWLFALYDGDTAEGERRFACLAVVGRSSLATFYYEAVGLDAEAFLARRKLIFDAVALAEYDYD